VDNVEAVAKRFNTEISTPLAEELRPDVEGTLLAKLHKSLESAREAMSNLDQMTAAGRDMLVLNREKVNLIVRNFQETSQHLKATSKELRRNPWRLLYKPDKPEREYQNLLDTARAFADAASYLDTASARLAALSEARPAGLPANDPQLLDIQKELRKAFEKFSAVEESLWEKLGK